MDHLKKISTLSANLNDFSLTDSSLNLSSLGLISAFSSSAPSFIIRHSNEQEAKLVVPGNKQVCDDVLKRFAVNSNVFAKRCGKASKDELEVYYNKTVDLADICGLEDVNQRINDFANDYQQVQTSLSDLDSQKAKYAPSTKLVSKISSLQDLEAEYADLLLQKEELRIAIEQQNSVFSEKSSIYDSLKIIVNQSDNLLSNNTSKYDVVIDQLEHRIETYENLQPTNSVPLEFVDTADLATKINWAINSIENSVNSAPSSNLLNSSNPNFKLNVYISKINEILDKWDEHVYSHKTLNWIHESFISYASNSNSSEKNNTDSFSLFDNSNNTERSATLIKILMKHASHNSSFLHSIFTDNSNKSDCSWVDESQIITEMLKIGALEEFDQYLLTQILFPLLSKKIIAVSKDLNSQRIRSTWND